VLTHLVSSHAGTMGRLAAWAGRGTQPARRSNGQREDRHGATGTWLPGATSAEIGRSLARTGTLDPDLVPTKCPDWQTRSADARRAMTRTPNGHLDGPTGAPNGTSGVVQPPKITSGDVIRGQRNRQSSRKRSRCADRERLAGLLVPFGARVRCTEVERIGSYACATRASRGPCDCTGRHGVLAANTTTSPKPFASISFGPSTRT
jgi:hypothetical protein